MSWDLATTKAVFPALQRRSHSSGGAIPCALALALLAAGCSTGGGSSVSAASDGGSASLVEEAGDVVGATSDVPHNPTVGCRDGYAPCGNECANFSTDPRHCGACGTRCLATQGCVGGACTHDAGAGACGGPFIDCDGKCAEIQTPDNCGSCGNRCGSARVCHRSLCFGAGGSGASCDGPLVLPQEYGAFSFRFERLTQRTFACGPLAPIPTHVFRWTATRSGAVTVNAASNGSGSRYVREIFTASSCDAAASIGCAEDVWTKFEVQAGTTYFIAVGELLAGTPNEVVYLTINE